MKKLYPNFLRLACAFVLLVSSWQASAQTRPSYCPELSGLPDTFFACINDRPLLPIARIDSVQAGTEILDTLWSPRTGLTHPDSIATFAYVDSSITYTLTLTSRRPNVIVNSDFQSRDTFFRIDGNPAFANPPVDTYFAKTNTLPLQPQFYFVTNNPSNAKAAYPSIGDHTTGTGNMLVVNGSTAPNKVVWWQNVNVIPGETYEFMGYATSLLPLDPAVLEWRVNGVKVVDPQNPSANPFSLIPNVLWTPMLVRYYNPSATTIRIEIVNLETAPDNGNDFALDDITVRALCIQKDSVHVKAINLDPLLGFNIRYGCGQDTVDFTADTTSPSAGVRRPPVTLPDRYLWQFGDGQTSTLQNPTHVYDYAATNQDSFIVKLYVYKDGVNPNGTITCSDSLIRVIRKRAPFYAGFTQDKDSICKGDMISFRDTSKPNTLPLVYYFGNLNETRFFDSSRLRDIDYTFDTAGVFSVLQVVTDPYNCKDTARGTVYSIAPVDLTFSLTDTVICEGQTIRVQTLIDSSYRQYVWNFDDGRVVTDSTAVSQTYLKAGIYDISFSATHNICPNVSKTRPLTVLETPRVNLGSDTFLCPNGQPILLQNLYPFNASTTQYLWNTGDQTPQILVRHDGTFYLKATNPKGCSTTDTVVITRNCFLDIPNVFTPNGDGESDYFLPRQLLSKGLMTFKMTVFNRWGQQVFETARTDGRGWDGKFNGIDQPTGVYPYFIEATLQNGATEKYEGNLTLLR